MNRSLLRMLFAILLVLSGPALAQESDPASASAMQEPAPAAEASTTEATPTTQPQDATDQQPAVGETLPRTASWLPWLALLGCASLGTGLGFGYWLRRHPAV